MVSNIMVYQHTSRQKGFSVVELLVAVLVSMIILSGVLQVVINSMQAYRFQDAISRLKNNGQYALEFLARDIRNADFWGCVPQLSQITNQLNSAGTGYNATYHAFTNGISGTANSSGSGGTVVGTDSITLQGVENPGSGNPLAVQLPYATSTSGSINVGTNSGITSGNIALVSDCTAGDIFQVTAIDGSGNISHAAKGSPGNISASFSELYTTQSYVYLPYTHIYNIQTGSDGTPALFQITPLGTNELVNNVQSMIILYGIDTDADGSANRYVRANNVTNMATVVSVRVSLLMQSLEDKLTTKPQPYIFNGATVTPTDYRVRRVYTATVSLRNRSS